MSIGMKVVIFAILVLLCVKLSSGDDCKARVSKAVIGSQCKKQLDILCDNKDILFTLWDASSRLLHSGLEATSSLNLGDYDLCTSIDRTINDVNIVGKYCLSSWYIQAEKSVLEEIVYAMESKDIHFPTKINAGRSENITIRGSECIPDACTLQEYGKVFSHYPLPVVPLPGSCNTLASAKQLTTWESIITICIGLVLLPLLCCTIYHVMLLYSNQGEPHDIVKAFSIVYNGKKLLTINTKTEERFSSIDGMRFLSMLWIILGHTYTIAQAIPVSNEEEVKEWTTHLYSSYVEAAHFAVDTFFFLSGFVLAFHYLKFGKSQSAISQLKRVPLMYVQRYLRLTPSITASFFITISFLKVIGNGPLWNNYITIFSKPCRDYWWRYYLYIQNYDTDNACNMQLWYVSVDMQLFLLAPLVLIPTAVFFHKKLRYVIWCLSILTCICIGISIGVPYLIDGYKNDYDTITRLSDYLVGIIGGVVLHRNKGKHVRINKVLNIALWVISFGLMIFVSIYLFDIVEHPTKDKTILFYPFSRTLWSLCILWIVYSCYFGYGGFINDFLSHPVFQVGSRLTYCMYVTHSMIIFCVVSEMRTYQYISDGVILYSFVANAVICILVSLIWTLAFESPMITITKMIFR